MFSLIEKFLISTFESKIGEDYLGNSYYISKFTKNYPGKNKRFVVYKSQQEPTKVPAEWHSWLHYLSDDVPKMSDRRNKQDQDNVKIRLPNLTGTNLSYSPKINQLSTNQIEIWKPK